MSNFITLAAALDPSVSSSRLISSPVAQIAADRAGPARSQLFGHPRRARRGAGWLVFGRLGSAARCDRIVPRYFCRTIAAAVVWFCETAAERAPPCKTITNLLARHATRSAKGCVPLTINPTCQPACGFNWTGFASWTTTRRLRHRISGCPQYDLVQCNASGLNNFARSLASHLVSTCRPLAIHLRRPCRPKPAGVCVLRFISCGRL
jgi:hypothetical protein